MLLIFLSRFKFSQKVMFFSQPIMRRQNLKNSLDLCETLNLFSSYNIIFYRLDLDVQKFLYQIEVSRHILQCLN